MNARDLKRIAATFEQDDYEIPDALEYYEGIDGPTIEEVLHPDQLWTILDRIETMVMDNEELKEKQGDFLNYFIGKWKHEIEPYCVRLVSE